MFREIQSKQENVYKLAKIKGKTNKNKPNEVCSKLNMKFMWTIDNTTEHYIPE